MELSKALAQLSCRPQFWREFFFQGALQGNLPRQSISLSIPGMSINEPFGPGGAARQNLSNSTTFRKNSVREFPPRRDLLPICAALMGSYTTIAEVQPAGSVYPAIQLLFPGLIAWEPVALTEYLAGRARYRGSPSIYYVRQCQNSQVSVEVGSDER